MTNAPKGNERGCRDIGSTGLDHVALMGCSLLARELATLISLGAMKVHLCPGEGESALEAIPTIESELAAKAETWVISESEAKSLAARIKPEESVADLPDSVGLVLVVTKCCGQERTELLKWLDSKLPPHVVIAAFLGADKLEGQLVGVKYPKRFVGFRIFPPVWDTAVAELVPADFTSDAALDFFKKFLTKLSKQILVIEDQGGNLSVRAFVGLVREAANMCDSGSMSPMQADEALRDMMGMRMGPLALADRIGLTVVADWCRSLARLHDEPSYDVPPILERNIKQGRLGYDAGAGFLDYMAS
ncbi:MAG: 3-hydroxybutyryl-CoA dehydrogenase [Planctomycetota bacterium]